MVSSNPVLQSCFRILHHHNCANVDPHFTSIAVNGITFGENGELYFQIGRWVLMKLCV